VQRYQQRPAEELYLVTDDPYEQRNLIDDPKQAERTAELRQTHDAWMAQTKDKQAVFGTPVPNLVK
jgi:hypothetical protein